MAANRDTRITTGSRREAVRRVADDRADVAGQADPDDPGIDEDAGHRGRDGHDGADRQVHAAGSDDDGHADREHDRRRAVAQDVDQAAVQVTLPHLHVEEPGDEDEVEQEDQAKHDRGQEEPAVASPGPTDASA